MAKLPKPQLGSGSKQLSQTKLGDSRKDPSPLMSLGGGKKDYSKKPKKDITDLGASSFGMTGLTGED
jgi:hypothetical protein